VRRSLAEISPAALGKRGKKDAAEWLHDLLKGPRPASPRLTQMPEDMRFKNHVRHSSAGETVDTGLPPRCPASLPQGRAAIRESTWSEGSLGTINRNFKRVVDHMEELMQEAVQIANDVAEFEHNKRTPSRYDLSRKTSWHSSGRDLIHNSHPGDKYPLPVLHEDNRQSARPSMPERRGSYSTGHEAAVDPDSIKEPVSDHRIILKNVQRDSSVDAQMICDHRHLLRTRSGNMWITVPQRLSSLTEIACKQASRQRSLSRSETHATVAAVNELGFNHRTGARSRKRMRLALLADLKEKTGSADPQCNERLRDRRKMEADNVSLDSVSDEVIELSDRKPDAKYGNAVNPFVRYGPAQRPISAGNIETFGMNDRNNTRPAARGRQSGLNLRGRSHVSLRGAQAFSLARSYQRQPIARDWSIGKKRFVAAVACISTACIGLLIGIYAGLVPAIQYWIADFNHSVIMGNVAFFLGLAIPTFFFWPLPLLHGRKPYILAGLVIAMPLLFPQAITVGTRRSPDGNQWKLALLLSRGLMGVALGFPSMNFQSILTDVFGASLMSDCPHQEAVDKYDVRRHGGGMGVWLGIWTWCFIGSIALGFLVGAGIINSLNPSWGFYVSIIIVAVVLFLNFLCPEVRRSAYRRSVAEIRNSTEVSRRVARGEIMMHRVKDGPKW
jgi:hypothetical protein